MKSIPSLVASSTVGIATTGLAFGRPQVSSPTRPTSHKRKATEYDMGNRGPSPPRVRPATSSADATPERDMARNPSPLAASSPADFRLLSDGSSPSGDGASHVPHLNAAATRAEAILAHDNDAVRRRSSVSSRPNSWIIRRLSLMQISSHQGSPRSSVGPESPSASFSHGSAAPILDSGGSPAPLPPNKLVKRSTSGRLREGELPARSGSRSHILTLRRPATSYQRSVTLQQEMKHEDMASSKPSPRQPGSSPASQRGISTGTQPPPDDATLWRPYFESRPTKLTKERPSARASESGMDSVYPTSRRIILPEGTRMPFLLKASKIKKITSWIDSFTPTEPETEDTVDAADSESSPMDNSLDTEPHKRARRSLSMQFSSPSKWAHRTGSMRGPKRGENTESTGRRHASAPIESLIGHNTLSTYSTEGANPNDIKNAFVYQAQSQDSSDDQEARTRINRSLQPRARINSSPRPRSRLSSLSIDLPRRGILSSSSSTPRRSLTPPKSFDTSVTPSPPSVTDRFPMLASSKVVIHQLRTPRIPEVGGSDRASTLVGSDTDARGFVSGDDDEVDFQSDTVFDSYRTGTTGSLRSRNTPLELMFDESPPDKGHILKATIVREIAVNGMFRESRDRIVEEDEGMSTPIKHRRGSDRDALSTPTRTTMNALGDAIRSSPPSFAELTRELDRPSIEVEDEDEDEDWTKEDDTSTIGNPLSPPSSSNSRRVNTTTRAALTDVTKTITSSANAGRSEYRPRSLFDWSEPLNPDKTDGMGNSLRPKTVHGKHAIDGRGGRTVGRRGPSALHIRSQSVPVIPDAAGHRENRKLAPKFGTWGLGGKGVNEDWDNDFEFDGVDEDEAENGTESMSGSAMLVPPAIQASQANVVGHVGQIREFCLLVEDLKRLRGLARERGIIDGPSTGLWRDAEGIIALAIPDEEDQILSAPRSPSLNDAEQDVIDDRYRDCSSDTDNMSETRVGRKSPVGHDQSSGLNTNRVHRPSVFSPEDDIFGAASVSTFHQMGEGKHRTIKSGRQLSTNGSTEVARSVMENIHQHRATSDPLRTGTGDLKKMPFDTTSLRDLVHRASSLSRVLAEIIRKADGPMRNPIPDAQLERDSSPAFTRLFSDPPSSPPRPLLRSESSNSMLSGSIDTSPTRGLEKQMHMTTAVA